MGSTSVRWAARARSCSSSLVWRATSCTCRSRSPRSRATPSAECAEPEIHTRESWVPVTQGEKRETHATGVRSDPLVVYIPVCLFGHTQPIHYEQTAQKKIPHHQKSLLEFSHDKIRKLKFGDFPTQQSPNQMSPTPCPPTHTPLTRSFEFGPDKVGTGLAPSSAGQLLPAPPQLLPLPADLLTLALVHLPVELQRLCTHRWGGGAGPSCVVAAGRL